MAVETQAVQIQIDVVDKNSAAAIGGVTKNIESMGTTAATAGAQTAQGMKAAGDAARGAGGHFQTSLDSVRLLRQELGIHVPRAMESMIARNQVLMSSISKLGGLMAGVGFATIGVAFAEEAIRGLQSVWNHINIVNNKLADYRAEIEKTQQQEFGNTYSIETSVKRIDEASDAAEDFGKKADEAKRQTLGWRSSLDLLAPGLGSIVQWWHALSAAGDMTDQQIIALRERAAADKTESSQYHEHQVKELGLSAAENEAQIAKLPAGAQAKAKHDAAIREARDAAAETRRFQNEQARMQGNSVAPNAGESEEKLTVATATAKANGELFAAQKAQAEELRKIHEEAVESGLRGSALYHAQEAAAEEDLKRRGLATAQAINDVRTKYHNEEMKRLEDEQRETSRIVGEAALAQFKGIAHTQAATDLEIGNIRGDRDISDSTKDERVAAARQKMNAEILTEEQAFTQQIDALSDEWAGHQVSGFARIRAEAQKAIDQKQHAFAETYGQLDHASPAYQQGAAQLNRGIGVVNSGAAQQTGDLTRRNAEETNQIEAEARAKLLSSEKQQSAAIETEYEQRTAKYLDELNAQEIGWDDYNRRVVAAGLERDAQLNEAAKAAREKMAGEFSHLFEHPPDTLKEMGQKAAGEAAAAMVQRVQVHFGGAGAAASSPGAAAGGMWDKVMGRIAGTPHAGAPAMPHGPHEASTASAMHIATAQISIGSASFAGLGGGGGAPSGGSSFAGGGGFSGGGSTVAGSGVVPGAAGGSTGLFAPGVSVSSAGGTGAPGSGFTGFSGFPGSGGSSTFTGASVTTPSIGGGGGSFAPGGNNVSGGGGTSGSGGSSSASGGAWGDSGATPSDVPSSARANFNAGSGAPPPPGQNKVLGALGSVKQGFGLFKQAKGIVGAGSGASSQDQVAETQDPSLSGTLNSDGTFTSAGSTNNGMLGGGGIGANLSGAASGALGMYAAVQGNGGVGGALGGAMSGMQLGMALGGPIGAGIGAAAGAIVGAIGFGGREKARVYDLQQVRPRLANDIDGLQQGSMDYLAAYSDIEALSREANLTTNKMGSAAKSYYQDTIKNEIKQAEGKLSSEERAGRSNYTTSAAQYDVGSDSVPRTGMAVIHERERIMPSDQNERITRALENGADSRTMAAQSGSGWGGDVHIHAIDAKSSHQWIMNNKHQFRAAINASYAENSGGADA